MLDCESGTQGERSGFEASWVEARRIDLDQVAPRDWLVRGTHACLRREGRSDWWLYLDRPEGRRLVGDLRSADAVEVLPTFTNGHADLRVKDANGERVVRYGSDGY